MTRPSSDQMKVMSREESWDAAHCIKVLSPTFTSALDGAKVIFVDSEEEKEEEDEEISDDEGETQQDPWTDIFKHITEGLNIVLTPCAKNVHLWSISTTLSNKERNLG